MRILSISTAIAGIALSAWGAAMALSADPAPRKATAYDPEGVVKAIIPMYADAEAYDDALYASISLTNGKIQTIFHNSAFVNQEEYLLETAVLADGIIYVPQFKQDMVTAEYEIVWKRVDASTNQRLSDISFGQDLNAFCYSLTYDSDAGKFYGLAVDLSTGAYGQLVSAVPGSEVPQVTLLGNVGSTEEDFMASIAYCPADKHLYGISTDGNMYMILPERGQRVLVKTFDPDTEWPAIPTMIATQPLVYSPSNHAFITTHYDTSNGTHVLGFIDFEGGNFDVVEGPDISMNYYIAALIADEPYAPDEAPAIPSIDSVDFEGPALEGSVTFTAPEKTFAGYPISADMSAIITIDGEEVYIAGVAPGESHTANLSLTEGEHNLSVACSLGEGLTGPCASRTIYTGYDSPMAPAQVVLVDSLLFWTPSNAAGEHGGYVETGDIKYNIYIDGILQNATPTGSNSYTIEMPARQKRVDISVTAIAAAKESQPSAPVSEVIGAPMQLPVAYAPTPEDATLFRTLDVNADGNEFKYYEKDGVPYMAIGTEQYYQKPDDWLFLPMTEFTDADKLYSLQFLHSNYYGGHLSDIDIYLGTQAAPEAMETLIYTHSKILHATDTPVAVNFSIPASGNYVIGIHSKAGASGAYRGDKFTAFELNNSGATISGMPADPTEVTVKAAPQGELRAVVSLTAPLNDMAGAPLPGDAEILIEASCGNETATASARPGQQVEMSLPVAANGFATIAITPSLGELRGIVRTYQAYIGLDKPTSPRNLTSFISDDNRSITLSWEAPAEGANGGYIDPSAISYNVYQQSSINYTKLGNTTETSYTYTPGYAKQAAYYLGASAVNEAGESGSNTFLYEIIGTPYQVPFIEEFNATGMTYSPWSNNPKSEYSECLWSSTSNLDGLGLGDPSFVQGGLICQNLGSRAGIGELMSPKITTAGVINALFALRYWNYSDAASLELWGCSTKNRELHKIADLTPSHPSSPAWEKWEVLLPEEFLDCGWIQLNLRADLPSSYSGYAIIDSFSIVMDTDYDFKLASIEMPEIIRVGDNASVSVTAINSGNETNSGTLTAEIIGDGKVLAVQEAPISRLASGKSFTKVFSFPVIAEYYGIGHMTVRASVASDKDNIPHNNEQTLLFDVAESFLPYVADLTATREDDGALLSWSEPDLSYGNFDSFEYLEPFINDDGIGQWLNIDMDGEVPFAIEGLRWEDDELPCAWTVFDAKAMGVLNDSRLAPHSGTQYLIARALEYDSDTEAPVQNNDWLISPEVVGGTRLSFWMNTIDSQYSETVELWTSSTDNDPSSFTKVRPFTKSGSEAWEEIAVTLPDECRYFALVYRSWGTFAAMIDDIEFTPVNLHSYQLAGYDVMRRLDGETENSVIATIGAATAYTDPTLGDAKAAYQVAPRIITPVGIVTAPASNTATVETTGVNATLDGASIAGGNNEIIITGLSGTDVAIYSADGKFINLIRVNSPAMRVAATPGVYIAKTGKYACKIIVR